VAKGSDKWESLIKQEELKERKEEAEASEKEDPSKYLMGCSQDHSKEIDIFNKPFKEKIARARAFKEEGNKYIQSDLGKASYYYA